MAEVLEKQYTAKKVSQKQDFLVGLAREGVSSSAADQTQVRINWVDSSLTRFSGSIIHQNNFEREAVASIITRIGQQEGNVTTNKLNTEGIREAVEKSIEAAKTNPPNADLADLPAGPKEYPFQVDFFETTAGATPEERAKLVIKGFEVNDEPAFKAAGILSTTQVNFAVVNSKGIEAAYNTTSSTYNIQWNGPDSSGSNQMISRNVGDIDIERLSVEALATAKHSANPKPDLEAGRYKVVLGPECLSTMLNFLSWLGFSGKDYLDGSSFLTGKMGQPIIGSFISIVDDPLDPRVMSVPCDASGYPKQRLPLIESGVVRNVVHDANTAKRAGTVSTGHDTGGNYPLPGSLVLSAGKLTKEDLIKEVERGVYINRFHYTNVVDPMATVITGMTRDGTFLIENGELTQGLTNFRFTQSIMDTLAKAWLSTEMVYYGAFWGAGCLVPDAAMVEEFNFSGKTEF